MLAESLDSRTVKIKLLQQKQRQTKVCPERLVPLREMRKVADFKRKKAYQSVDCCTNGLLARCLLFSFTFGEVYVQFLQKRVTVRTRASWQNRLEDASSQSKPSAYISCSQHEAICSSNDLLNCFLQKSLSCPAATSELVRTVLLATKLLCMYDSHSGSISRASSEATLCTKCGPGKPQGESERHAQEAEKRQSAAM